MRRLPETPSCLKGVLPLSQCERSVEDESAELLRKLELLDREIKVTRQTLYKLENPSDFEKHHEMHARLDWLINEYTRLAERLRRGR